MHSGYCICCYFIEHRLIFDIVPRKSHRSLNRFGEFYFFINLCLCIRARLFRHLFYVGLQKKEKKNTKPLKPHMNTPLLTKPSFFDDDSSPSKPRSNKCVKCGKTMPAIGTARKRGKRTHGDWKTRTLHKKCWKELVGR